MLLHVLFSSRVRGPPKVRHTKQLAALSRAMLTHLLYVLARLW